MKSFIFKVMIAIIIFGVACVGVTFGLLQMKQSNGIIVENESGNLAKEPTNTPTTMPPQEKQPTLNLKGKYDENDLIISETTEQYKGINIDIPSISGLKNKSIEQNINKEIREKIYQIANELGEEVSSIEFYDDNAASFSNVISIHVMVFMKNDNLKNLCFNYELINGTPLTLDDVLVKNADIQSMIRKSIFENLVLSSDYWGDENKVVSIDEDELYSKLISFLNDECDFYFTPKNLCLVQKHGSYIYYDYDEKTMASTQTTRTGEVTYFVPISQYANQIILYDKYKGKYDLYERDDIGSKNIYPCSKIVLENYSKYGFEADNLWLKLSIIPEKGNSSEKNIQRLRDYKNYIKKEFAEKEVSKYKELAQKSPDSAFVIQKTYYLSPVRYNNYNEKINKETKIFCVIEGENVIEITDKKLQEGLEDELASSFEQTGYYDSNIWIYGNEKEGIIRDDETEAKSKKYNVNIDTFEKFNNYNELFYEGGNYQEIIRNKIRTYTKWDDSINQLVFITRTEEEINQILSEAEIYFNYDGLSIQDPKKSVYEWISFEAFMDEFKYWAD